MLSFFIPKEMNFFDSFDEQAVANVEAAQILIDLLEHYEEAPAKVARLQTVEHRADEITHRTLGMLHKTFITPMDRDQIHSLVNCLDDVVDLIDGTSRRMLLYDIKTPRKNLVELAKVLLSATKEVQKGVTNLRDMKNAKAILGCCIEINKLENDGDALRDAAVAELLKNSTNAVEILIWKEIYEMVESAIDRCEDVADVLEGVVLENA
jgi:predicted phosphate transport protein (TIGR00153 family)